MSFAARQYQISVGNLPCPKSLLANVVYSSSQYGNVSNFALTPFSLDGQSFASVESFIQYLKYRPDDDRRTLAPNLFGVAAKRAGSLINREVYPVIEAGGQVRVYWLNQELPYRSQEHTSLIKRALTAKFEQSAIARRELLSTANTLTGEEKQIVHKTRKESAYTSLPSTEFAQMLTDIRRHLLAAAEPQAGESK